MPDRISVLKQENASLQANVKSLSQEIAALKVIIEQHDARTASRSGESAEGLEAPRDKTEEEHSLFYLSKEYDDLNSFRNTTKLELQRLSKRLAEISAKIDNIAQAIDEFQEYSYRYNVKIVGVPEKRTATKETSDETSTLCVALFGAMGVDVSLSDIDTTHRVPSRNNPRQEPKPNPIICKFVRRLTREKVMARRSDACKVDPAALGFQDTQSLSAVRVFDHLTPRSQEILFEANKFKIQNHYKYCWSKNGAIYLRKEDESRAVRIKNVSDFQAIATGR